MKNPEKNIYYAAYGMNTNFMTVLSGCPSAKPIGKGILEGHKLECQYYFNIVEAKDSSMEVAIWRLKESDIKVLDRIESYPWLYERKTVTVKTNKGEMLPAIIYFMTTNAIESSVKTKLPRESYLLTCRGGYNQFKMSQEQIDRALAECK